MLEAPVEILILLLLVLALLVFSVPSIARRGRRGPRGEVGSPGFPGSPGESIIGPLGPQGAVGLQGASGGQGGSQGPVGPQGSQGITGSFGVQGSQGSQGITGSVGVQGSQGTQGITGPVGGQGTQGTQGSQGTQGIQGVQGPTGPGSVDLFFMNTTIPQLEIAPASFLGLGYGFIPTSAYVFTILTTPFIMPTTVPYWRAPTAGTLTNCEVFVQRTTAPALVSFSYRIATGVVADAPAGGPAPEMDFVADFLTIVALPAGITFASAATTGALAVTEGEYLAFLVQHGAGGAVAPEDYQFSVGFAFVSSY